MSSAFQSFTVHSANNPLMDRTAVSNVPAFPVISSSRNDSTTFATDSPHTQSNGQLPTLSWAPSSPTLALPSNLEIIRGDIERLQYSFPHRFRGTSPTKQQQAQQRRIREHYSSTAEASNAVLSSPPNTTPLSKQEALVNRLYTPVPVVSRNQFNLPVTPMAIPTVVYMPDRAPQESPQSVEAEIAALEKRLRELKSRGGNNVESPVQQPQPKSPPPQQTIPKPTTSEQKNGSKQSPQPKKVDVSEAKEQPVAAHIDSALLAAAVEEFDARMAEEQARIDAMLRGAKKSVVAAESALAEVNEKQWELDDVEQLNAMPTRIKHNGASNNKKRTKPSSAAAARTKVAVTVTAADDGDESTPAAEVQRTPAKRKPMSSSASAHSLSTPTSNHGSRPLTPNSTFSPSDPYGGSPTKKSFASAYTSTQTNEPSPQSYEQQKDAVLPRSPVAVMLARPVFAGLDLTVRNEPSPQTYPERGVCACELCNVFAKSKNVPTMKKGFSASAVPLNNVPGPGAYSPSLEFVSTKSRPKSAHMLARTNYKPRFELNHREPDMTTYHKTGCGCPKCRNPLYDRSPTRKVPPSSNPVVRPVSPGPGEYNVDRAMNIVKTSNPAITLAPRTIYVSDSNDVRKPGVGTYHGSECQCQFCVPLGADRRSLGRSQKIPKQHPVP